MTETSIPIVQIALRTERDVVHARQKAREVAAALGLDNQDQIRMATAASEMARNAFRYARSGKVSFLVKIEAPQSLQIVITDGGPGIANIDDILIELDGTKIPERAGRALDHETEDAFERLRVAGYL